MQSIKKEMRINAFDMNSIGHLSPGLWAHPRDGSLNYNDINHWTSLAKTLERGKFDALFIADVLGIYDVFRGNAHAALSQAVQVPINDPFLLVPAMAAVTEHLCFGLTGTLTYEPPYTFARRISTLDHLTNGRLAWNIVTGYLNSAAKGLGLEKQDRHDDRYDIAEEYMEVVYKLWEGSWDDEAVLHDKKHRLFADPTKIRKIRHKGRHYELDAYHLCEPSPQRTPILFQAGASKRGSEFAAKHAECVFIFGPSKRVVKSTVDNIRRLAALQGRDPASIVIFTVLTAVPGRTDAEAEAKLADYRSYISLEGAMALFGGWTGVDLSRFDLDAPIRYVESDAIQSMVEGFTVADPDRVWTVREVAEFVGIGGIGPVLAGGPKKLADELESWVKDTGIDGFNLAYALCPESFVDFVDLVVPELQERGVFKRNYASGTMREKLYGPGKHRLAEDHPGSRFAVPAASQRHAAE
jgi:FMN-dependent oxidoreductase (nitrilotriacetate monooxygenase family)